MDTNIERFMKKKTLLVITAATLLQVGCASSQPVQSTQADRIVQFSDVGESELNVSQETQVSTDKLLSNSESSLQNDKTLLANTDRLLKNTDSLQSNVDDLVITNNTYTKNAQALLDKTGLLLEMSLSSYCKAGEIWGSRLRNTSGSLYDKNAIDKDFIHFLRTGEDNHQTMSSVIGRFYFGVDEQLRRNFHDCFRAAFDRIDADNVLGDHIAAAAGVIGNEVGSTFAQWPLAFYQQKVNQQRKSFSSFEVMVGLINEDATNQLQFFRQLLTSGSPADRFEYKTNFVCAYRNTMKTTLLMLGIEFPLLKQYPVQPEERLVKRVHCADPPMHGYRLEYEMSADAATDSVDLFVANHAVEEVRSFRIYSAEELFLRYYRQALHKVGEHLGNGLYHGLIKRDDAIGYIHNLAVLVERSQDLSVNFAQGFVSGFPNGGAEFLQSIFCEIKFSTCSSLISLDMSKISVTDMITTTSMKKISGCYIPFGVFRKEINVKKAHAMLNQLNLGEYLQASTIDLRTGGQGVKLGLGFFADKASAQKVHQRITSSLMKSDIGQVICS